VNGLLDFSRIEAGRVDATYQPVDLGAYTADIASTFRSAVERVGLRLMVDCESSREPTYVDRDMWEKIVLNLISNAFKFTLEGEIGVSMRQVGDRMRLLVRDTGAGIPSAELPRIFERFHRVEGTTGRTHEGTGIGLALVHELVKFHGGAIDVDSEPGRGTMFTVTIPLGTAHLPAERIQTTVASLTSAARDTTLIDEVARWSPDDLGDVEDGDLARGGGGIDPPEKATRILLADDNADMRAYLSNLLGQRWSVLKAGDGLEALTVARSQPPDLIITDVMMPRMDGFGLLRELRADERTRHVPVMMLSARAGDESRVEGFQAGADDYLVKPFTAREMLARVDAHLLRARVRTVEERTTRRMASVLAQAPVPIAIVRGPDHVCEMANDACVALFNSTVLGKRLADALPELAAQGIIAVLDRVYASGEPYAGVPLPLTLERGPDRDPERRYFDVVCQPLFDDAHAVEGIAIVGYDVTELASTRQAAEEANRAKDEFLAMLGHELRNPLAPILTAVQLLRLRGGPSGERERTIIERQVRHLVRLVDDLLDISRITRGKISLDAEPIELNEVVAKAIELASPLLEQHRHAFEADVPRHGLGVMADPSRLAQVIGNLLTNSAKYTAPGGQIRVSGRAEEGQVVLTVSDTGIGIDADMLPRVFDLFTQSRQAIDRAQGGLGLGLAIVRTLVALHGGSVTASSEGRGRGSEFVVRLPRVPVVAAAEDLGYSVGRRAEVEPSGLRVLVVDDNADAAVLLADALSASGHLTATAADGPTALEAAAEFAPDVALLDIGLPVIDGFELARQFRANPKLCRTRLIAVTGYGQEHDRRHSTAAGFDEHLTKPVDLGQLNGLVHSLTRQSK
jgi:signal transduction histidine kinase/FixJ family two-component response regulator